MTYLGTDDYDPRDPEVPKPIGGFKGVGMPEVPNPYAEYMAAMQAMLEKQQAQMEAQRRQQAVTQIDQFLTNRETAYTTAMEEINDIVAANYARSNLYGMDYAIDQAEIDRRINVRFGEYWDKKNDESMLQLMNEFATPQQWEQFRSRVQADPTDIDKDNKQTRVMQTARQRSQKKPVAGKQQTALTGSGVIVGKNERQGAETLSAILG